MAHALINTIWYRDWQAQNGWRYRLTIQPPVAVIDIVLPGLPPIHVSITDGGPLPSTTVPAWGGAPDPDTSIYEPIPPNCIVNDLVTSQTNYDGPAIGWPLTPELTIKFDLHPLATGNSYLRFLKYFLLNPIGFEGGAFDLADGGTAPFDTSVAYTLSTDRGAPSTGVEDFTVAFQGAQRKNPTKTLTIHKRGRVCEFEVKIAHIARYCLEAITAPVIAKTFFEYWNAPSRSSHWRPSTGEQASRFQYDHLFKNGSVTYARAHGEITYGDGQKARYYAVEDLWFIIERLATDAYNSMLRTSGATAELQIRSNLGSDHSVFNLLTFYELDYTPANGRGPALDRLRLSFCGYVWPKEQDSAEMISGVYDVKLAANVLIGGFLVDHGDNSIFKYKNAWDFLKATCDDKPLKAQIIQVGPEVIRIQYHKIFANNFGTHNLRYQDIETTEQSIDVHAIIGDNLVTGATIAVPGVTGEDANSIAVKIFGVRNEQVRPIELSFHNNPIIDDSANFAQMHNNSASPFAYNPDLLGDMICSLSAGFNARTLCYFATPSFISPSTEVPIRVHAQVGIDLGRGSLVIDGEQVALPTTSVFKGRTTDDAFVGGWWNDMKQAMFAEQQVSCLGYAIGYRLALLLSDEKQTAYEVTLPVEHALPNDLGEMFTFVDGSSIYAGANIFLDDGFSYLGELPGACHLLSLETDYTVGRSKARLLGIPP